VSIYVNPTQFGPHEDLACYPRDLAGDLKQCRATGADVVFTPTDGEMYPNEPMAPYSTYVVEDAVSKGMEGASRPTHFRGVTTIVAKLFHLVLPDVAVFGAKDYQQAAVVRRMVRDLSFPLEIVVAPTVREPDGLALSSRNKYLKGEERAQATVLWQTIQEARARVGASSRGIPAERLDTWLREHVLAPAAAQVDYIAFFDPDTLAPRSLVTLGTHLALAVQVGKTRLIDNARLD
jgi:pantoate--beta-alanine ligase